MMATFFLNRSACAALPGPSSARTSSARLLGRSGVPSAAGRAPDDGPAAAAPEEAAGEAAAERSRAGGTTIGLGVELSEKEASPCALADSAGAGGCCCGSSLFARLAAGASSASAAGTFAGPFEKKAEMLRCPAGFSAAFPLPFPLIARAGDAVRGLGGKEQHGPAGPRPGNSRTAG